MLADDAVLFREGMARILTDVGFTVTGQAGDGAALLDLVRADPPDVAVIDLRMPPDFAAEGIDTAAAIRATAPATGLMLLSQYVEVHHAMRLMTEFDGGVGYLLKDRVSDLDHFADAVRRVGEGGSALDPEVVSEMLGRRRIKDPLAELTSQERNVLGLMAEGRSNRAIADTLVISERAVEKHVTSIFAKLKLAPAPEDHRRVLAVLAFLGG